MEAQEYYVIHYNASEVKIRYEYKFYESNMRVTLDGRDLADSLDLKHQLTPKDMNFEPCMEI